MRLLKIILPLVCITLLLAGCAAPVRIMTPATESLAPYKAIQIEAPQNDIVGKIDKAVVDEIVEDAVEGILDLKYFDRVIVSEDVPLKKELSDKVLRPSMLKDSTIAVASLKTTIAEYDEGSATLRFFFGAFAGGGKVTLELSVLDGKTKKLLLKGTTTANITGSFASVDNVVGPLSKAIVNFTEDNIVKAK
jgi:hypothetical protein